MNNNNVSNDKSSDTGSIGHSYGKPSASKAGTVALLAFSVFAMLTAPIATNAEVVDSVAYQTALEIVEEQKARLDARLVKLEAEQLILEAEYNIVNKRLTNAISVITDEQHQAMFERYVELHSIWAFQNAKYAELEASFTSMDPAIIAGRLLLLDSERQALVEEYAKLDKEFGLAEYEMAEEQKLKLDKFAANLDAEFQTVAAEYAKIERILAGAYTVLASEQHKTTLEKYAESDSTLTALNVKYVRTDNGVKFVADETNDQLDRMHEKCACCDMDELDEKHSPTKGQKFRSDELRA